MRKKLQLDLNRCILYIYFDGQEQKIIMSKGKTDPYSFATKNKNICVLAYDRNNFSVPIFKTIYFYYQCDNSTVAVAMTKHSNNVCITCTCSMMMMMMIWEKERLKRDS